MFPVLGSAFIALGLSALLGAVGLIPTVRMVSAVSGQTGPLLVLGLVVSLLLTPLVEEIIFRCISIAVSSSFIVVANKKDGS